MNIPLARGTGLTRRKLKKPSTRGTKFSTTKGDNKGRPPQIVSYCPQCTSDSNKADPERLPHVAAINAREGKCKNGHVWTVGGKSYTGGAA